MANTATQVRCRVFKTKGASVSANYSGHSGVDVTADGGFDYVVAHSAGEVVWVQTGYGNLKGSEGDPSYGNAVQLRHANGWCTLYAHMREVNVSYGQQVGRGAVLG
ncbi:MAG: M23 family metallopeptidase, partial [Acutalibacteraceae bacterium]